MNTPQSSSTDPTGRRVVVWKFDGIISRTGIPAHEPLVAALRQEGADVAVADITAGHNPFAAPATRHVLADADTGPDATGTFADRALKLTQRLIDVCAMGTLHAVAIGTGSRYVAAALTGNRSRSHTEVDDPAAHVGVVEVSVGDDGVQLPAARIDKQEYPTQLRVHPSATAAVFGPGSSLAGFRLPNLTCTLLRPDLNGPQALEALRTTPGRGGCKPTSVQQRMQQQFGTLEIDMGPARQHLLVSPLDLAFQPSGYGYL